MTASQKMTFMASLKYGERGIPYKQLREAIRDATNSIEGLEFDSIEQMTEPDPYDFADPDNLPKGIY